MEPGLFSKLLINYKLRRKRYWQTKARMQVEEGSNS
jgi:hypothetical protein